MRTNVVLNDELVAEAMELSGAKTKREVIQLALAELVARRRRKDLFELAGQLRFVDDVDHKAMRVLRGDPD